METLPQHTIAAIRRAAGAFRQDWWQQVGDRAMEQDREQAIREAAYFLWEREGRPEGRAPEHWQQAERELGLGRQDGDALEGEAEAVMDGDPEADYPAVLTKDVPGG